MTYFGTLFVLGKCLLPIYKSDIYIYVSVQLCYGKSILEQNVGKEREKKINPS